MHYALRRNTGSTRKTSDRRRGSFLSKSSEIKCGRGSSKDHEQSLHAQGILGDRIVYVTLLTLESDGQLKIIALPVCFHETSDILEGSVKMNGVHRNLPAAAAAGPDPENEKSGVSESEKAAGEDLSDSHPTCLDPPAAVCQSSGTDASDVSSGNSSTEKLTRKNKRKKAKQKAKRKIEAQNAVPPPEKCADTTTAIVPNLSKESSPVDEAGLVTAMAKEKVSKQVRHAGQYWKKVVQKAKDTSESTEEEHQQQQQDPPPPRPPPALNDGDDDDVMSGSDSTHPVTPVVYESSLCSTSDKFTHALCGVLESRHASADFERSGCPVSRLEAFIRAASPVTGSGMGQLWKWYERHGSYGLQVRVEETPFSHAYFVPFLSAVQLFGIPAIASRSSPIPMLSVLVPGSSPPTTALPPSCSDGAELLFEYFENEQPQRRRPLFEMVDEMVRDGGERVRCYGDPTKLVSTDVRELHPRSWYAVAWYPIYMIPEAVFRAAFVTYHALERDGSRPVVGLESYNARSEGWFAGADEARVRTLEHMASLFARAHVFKGKQRSTNRHPDYEFFVSRRRG